MHMRYSKQALSIDKQIARLKERGLKFENEEFANEILNRISYYRLRAYTYPFQDNTDPNHPFTLEKTFEEIIRLYDFDRVLRILIFRATEVIEVALRTQIVYHMAMKHGSHWYTNRALFWNGKNYDKDLTALRKEIERSSEDFIKHYNQKYKNPEMPPAWMSLEVVSFGTLSRFYKNIRRSEEKKKIASYFGLKDKVLENWMHAISNVRNICAHHARLYNRKHTVTILTPNNTYGNQWISNHAIDKRKLYAIICSIAYLTDRFSNNDFKQDILKILEAYPDVDPIILGFPEHWQDEDFWNQD